jgi:hypothetical protein
MGRFCHLPMPRRLKQTIWLSKVHALISLHSGKQQVNAANAARKGLASQPRTSPHIMIA